MPEMLDLIPQSLVDLLQRLGPSGRPHASGLKLDEGSDS